MKPSRDIARLLEIMAALRTPLTGCPWDLRQTFRTIAPYTIEEAYEVADAIERDDPRDLKDELGDLLLQVVFHARMASEKGAFDFGDVVEAITFKMIRRHPHVFGPAAGSVEANEGDWERIKAEERAEKAASSGAPASILDDVAAGLPSLIRATKLQKRAAKVGFDWLEPRSVIAKIREELDELEAEIGAAPSPDASAVGGELGDVLFALVNLARHLDVDPDAALRGTNEKFARRFRFIEQALGERLGQAGLEEMEALWQSAKLAEQSRGSG
jgi:ATP diphosphatase